MTVQPRTLPLNEEIANLEHRLAFLKGRQTTLLRLTPVFLLGFKMTIAFAFAILVVVTFVKWTDPVVAIFFWFIGLSVLGLGYWATRAGDPTHRKNRSLYLNKYNSFWAFLDEEIALCEAHLDLLKRHSK
jgi:hypothetical protein